MQGSHTNSSSLPTIPRIPWEKGYRYPLKLRKELEAPGPPNDQITKFGAIHLSEDWAAALRPIYFGGVPLQRLKPETFQLPTPSQKIVHPPCRQRPIVNHQHPQHLTVQSHRHNESLLPPASNSPNRRLLSIQRRRRILTTVQLLSNSFPPNQFKPSWIRCPNIDPMLRFSIYLREQ